MEIVFYNSLMKPKTFFGMPLIFLEGVVSISGFMCFMNFLKAGFSVQTILSVTGISLVTGYLVFSAVKDKLLLEIIIYNSGLPKKIGF